MIPPDYIGDAVYATDNGYGVTLTTGTHIEREAGNVIVLEPAVIAGLERYIARMKAHYSAKPAIVANPEVEQPAP